MIQFIVLFGIFDGLIQDGSTYILGIWQTNGTFIAGIVLGAILGWLYSLVFAGRIVRRSYREQLASKDELINEYKQLVNHELSKIKTDHFDPKLIRGLKRFFRAKSKEAFKRKRR